METVSTSVELMVFIMACLYSDLEKKKKRALLLVKKSDAKKKYLLQNDSHKSHCSANFYEIEGTQKPTQTKWMGFKISKCYVPPSEKKNIWTLDKPNFSITTSQNFFLLKNAPNIQ